MAKGSLQTIDSVLVGCSAQPDACANLHGHTCAYLYAHTRPDSDSNSGADVYAHSGADVEVRPLLHALVSWAQSRFVHTRMGALTTC